MLKLAEIRRYNNEMSKTNVYVVVERHEEEFDLLTLIFVVTSGDIEVRYTLNQDGSIKPEQWMEFTRLLKVKGAKGKLVNSDNDGGVEIWLDNNTVTFYVGKYGTEGPGCVLLKVPALKCVEGFKTVCDAVIQ